MLKAIATVVVLAVGAVLHFLYPYWTLIQISDAIRARDAIQLERLIDWAQVRAGLKSDARAFILGRKGPKDEPFEAIGNMLGASYIDTLVDSYVSANTLTGSEKQAPDALVDNFGNRGFAGPTTFFVDISAPNDPALKFTAIMELSGVTWRVTRIILPAAAMERTAAKAAKQAK